MKMNQHIPFFETFGKFGKFGNSTTLQGNDHTLIFSLFLTLQLYSENEPAYSEFRPLERSENYATLQLYLVNETAYSDFLDIWSVIKTF